MFIVVFALFLKGRAMSAIVNTTYSIMEHGIREAIIAGIIIVLLVVLHSFVLSKKGGGAGGCGSGACGYSRILEDKDTVHCKRRDREVKENTGKMREM